MSSLILDQKIEQCCLHLDRMKQAYTHIKHLYPFRAESFPLEKYEDLTSLDMFTSRFAKLQDSIAEGLFVEFLKFLGENASIPVIDRLNKLEKYKVLKSANEWKELRDLRNDLVHEYPDSYLSMAQTLNTILEKHQLLEDTLNNVVNEYTLRKK